MMLMSNDKVLLIKKLFILLATKGVPTTFLVAMISFLLALIVGFIVGIILFFKVPIISLILKMYINFIRGIPALILLYFSYHVLPYIGIRMDSFNTSIFCLTVYSGAYVSEIVRSALQSIPKTQHEASESLAFNTFQRMWYIIIPQAVKISLPPIASQSVHHIKTTSLLSLIALRELTRIAKVQIQSNYEPLITYGILAVFYFVICYPLLRLTFKLEKRYSIK